MDQKHYYEDLSVGMSAGAEMEITADRIDAFADVVGDHNPIHVDAAYAEASPFGERIAHGALSASLISAVLGNDLPGPGAVFLEMNLRYRAPAMIGDVVHAHVEITEKIDRTSRVNFKCRCEAQTPEGERKLLCRGSVGVMVAKKAS